MVCRLRAASVGHRMGSPVFQRSASAAAVSVVVVVGCGCGDARVRTSAAADVRDQAAAKAPGPACCRPGQAERAVQTRPAAGVRPPAGVRQAGGPARGGQALRAGRQPAGPVGGGGGCGRHGVRGPVRVRVHIPAGRQLFRQRRGPAERHGRVHARFRVPVQGHPAVRLPDAVAHRLRAVRTSGDRRRPPTFVCPDSRK